MLDRVRGPVVEREDGPRRAHDFGDATDPAGAKHRVPGKSHFTTPNRQKADLTVEWGKRQVNVAIDPAAFKLGVPAGLPTCGPAPAKK